MSITNCQKDSHHDGVTCHSCRWSYSYIVQQGSETLCNSLRCAPYGMTGGNQKAEKICDAYQREPGADEPKEVNMCEMHDGK